ncbi:MAG: ACT domain-containing protein [Faecousia sp.]
MHIHQISVFLENRTGQLSEITDLLAKANIDIRAISIAETADYGLARMIVDDSQKASAILLQHGDILSMTPVWAVEVPDRPGGLHEVLEGLAEANVDVEYMYSLFTHQDGKAYMVMRITDEPKFLSTLGTLKIKIMTKEELGLK